MMHVFSSSSCNFSKKNTPAMDNTGALCRACAFLGALAPLARDCLAYVDSASSVMQHGQLVPVVRNVVIPGLVLDA